MREIVRDRIVKPICFDPLRAASSGLSPCFYIARDVLDHDDSVVDDEACRDGEGHEGEVVHAEAHEIHGAERADERKGHGDARYDRRGEVPEEEEDDEHHEGYRKHQLELHVPHGCADRRGAVGQDGDLHGGRKRAPELRQEGLDAVHHLDDVGARLPLDVEDNRRRIVHPRGLLNVFRVIDRLCNIGEFYGSAVLVRDDDGPVLAGGKELVVGPDDIGLARTVKAALCLVDVRRPKGGAHVFEGQAVGGERRRITCTRTAGLWPPLMLTRPMPGSCEIFWANLVSARSSTRGRGRVFEARASVRIGVSAGFTLLYTGGVGRSDGRKL